MSFNWEAFWAKKILAPEADALCRHRDCYQPGQDKGSYSPGRGYTSYHAKPLPVCMTRLCHGCPAAVGLRDGEDHVMRPEIDWRAAFDAITGHGRHAERELRELCRWLIIYHAAHLRAEGPA